MRFFFVVVVLAALLVGMIWAAQLDRGPLVINREDEYRIVLRLGKPIDEMVEAGWRLRIPLLDEVQVFDRRLQYLNAAATEIEIGENQRLIVDYYVIWQIATPLEFRRSFPGGLREASDRIQQRVGSLVGASIGNLTMQELLSRAEVLEALDTRASEALASNGVRVVDVRINRTELPLKAEAATFEQMREQRRAISREKRAIGQRAARELRAQAEREALEIVASARSRAEILRGEGDAEAARIYAQAYGKDPEFYGFVRSLEAYRKTLGQRTTLVVPPDHEFFRFLDPTRSIRREQDEGADSTPIP
jgi:membrane protease subunit HflC